VGKSTILNSLAGATLRKTGDVRRSDSRGRHTTSLRELFVIDDAGCLIDSPGVREVGLWGDESMLDDTFSDVSDLAEECKFSDCAHESEPGCAVKEALQTGGLSQDRYESYLKLKKELEFVAARTDERLRRKRRDRRKEITRFTRTVNKRKGPTRR
jgi:ribosome biogenesis GTPase